MTAATRTAPPHKPPQAIERQDTRKRTEADADFARLHAATVKRLSGVVRRFVADLRRSDMADAHAQSVFIHAATAVLRGAYEAGHREGQRDYWQTFSRRRNPTLAEPSDERTKRILGWYAVASLAKMAREGVTAAQAARHANALSEHYTLAQGDALDDWQSGLGQRVALQASISWVGLQDGYVDAGDTDPAGLPMSVYWILGPAVHCGDCLDLATNSPYDPPWGNYHGNPLTQSPGDGQTVCGASCKCDLDYRPDWRRVNEGLVADTWKIWLGSGAGREAIGNIGTGAGFGPNEALLPPEVPERIGGPARGSATDTPSGMSDAQIAALDRFRDASAAWNRVRGALPEAPELFAEVGAPDVKFETMLELPAWDQLTREQQQAVTEMLAAVWDWVDALGDGEQQFTEALDDADAIRLYGHPPGYSQARYRNGQWAPGDGGEHVHGGSGGGRQGEHEAARGGGALHGAGAGEVHAARVGGGGGGSSGGSEHERPQPFSQREFEVARRTMIHFNGGVNEVGYAPIGPHGTEYMIKRVPESQVAPELASHEIARELGLHEHIVPEMYHLRDEIGDHYIVQNYVNGHDFFATRREALQNGQDEWAAVRDELRAVSPHDMAHIGLFEHVVMDGDRHSGNYLMNDATHTLLTVDHGLSFQSQVRVNSFSMLIQHGMEGAHGTNYEQFKLPRSEVERIVRSRDRIMSIARGHGIAQDRLDRLSARLDAIEAVSRLPHATLTMGDLRSESNRIAHEIYVREHPDQQQGQGQGQ